MCGIIFAENFAGQPVNTFVTEQYQKQRSRGTEGFGLFDRINERLVRTPKERKIKSYLRRHEHSSIMFHHRFPTSTMNRGTACHPFSTGKHFDTKYVLVHNGHIYNSWLLKADHKDKGIEYSSWSDDERKFNDSEALLWDVALYLEGEQDKLEAYGNIAFVCLAIPKDKRKATKLYFGRNTNPLNMQYSNQQILLSSEGEGTPIEHDQMYCYDYRSKELNKTALTIPSYATGGASNSGFQSNCTTYGSGYSSSGWENEFDDDFDYRPLTSRSREGWRDTNEGAEDYPETYMGKRGSYIPKDESFVWNTLYPRSDNETMVFRLDGSPLPVRETLRERIETYLEASDGVYTDAYGLVGYDIHLMRRQLENDRISGYVDDDDLLVEIEILEHTLEAFHTCPQWIDDESKDSRYATTVTA